MFHGNERCAVLALEEAVVAVEQVLVDPLGEARPFGLQLFLARLEVLLAKGERGHVALDFFLLLGMGFQGCLERGLEALGLLHEQKFAVLDLDNQLFGDLDLVAQGGKLLVLAGLQLLVAVAGDLVLLGLHLHFQLLALDLDLLLAGARRLKPVVSRFQFPVACGLLGGKCGDLGQDGSQLLVAVLEREQLLDFREHQAAYFQR